MKIEPKSLNLVVPIETESGVVHVHSAPIRRETFKQNFLILSKTMSAIYEEGLHNVAGPRIAAMMLQKIAEEAGEKVWEAVQNGVMAEIRRLSNALVLTPDGWKSVPLETCVAQGYLTGDEVEEAEGFIVFFTCISHIHRNRCGSCGMYRPHC